MIENFFTKRAQSRGDSGFARVLTIVALMLIAATGAWADDWTNIVINSNMEGTDVSCFYVKENAMGSDNIYLAHITDGIGKDDSRAIRVRSTGNEENTWDTQFFIRLPYELPAGTSYRLSFDYKANNNADADFQCANEPGEYIIWYIGENDTEDFSFTTDWQNFSKEYTVPADANGNKHTDADWLDNFQTIYFSLALNKVATEFIIDNVKVEILNSVLPTLTPSPVTDPKLMVAYPPYTVSLAEGTVDADNWTITPAEGAYEGETVTATYNGTKHVKSVKAVKKAAAPAAKAAAEATAEDLGKVIGADGNIYADADAATAAGATAVAMIAYVGSETGVAGYTNGLALALTDEASTMEWSTATGASGAAAHTPAAPTTTSSWMLPSKDQWNKMITAAGGYTALRDGFSGIAGASNLQSNFYWSSTEDDSNNANAWLYRFSNGQWYHDSKGYGDIRVRACLAF